MPSNVEQQEEYTSQIDHIVINSSVKTKNVSVKLIAEIRTDHKMLSTSLKNIHYGL